MTANEILSYEEIHEEKMTKIIGACMEKMAKWGVKLPRNIIWRNAQIHGMGETVWIEDTSTGNTSINIILNSGLSTQSNAVIEDTVYHELAHAATGDVHTGQWLKVVKKIREKTGLEIKESATVTDVTNAYWLAGYKYVFKCTKCGQLIGFNEMNDLVKDPNQKDASGNTRFTHRGCGGTWERIK